MPELKPTGPMPLLTVLGYGLTGLGHGQRFPTTTELVIIIVTVQVAIVVLHFEPVPVLVLVLESILRSTVAVPAVVVEVVVVAVPVVMAVPVLLAKILNSELHSVTG